MADGLASGTATSFLNVLRNTSYTGIATVYVQLHNGAPGAAGTTNVTAAFSGRQAITWNAPSAGSMTLLSLANFTMTGTDTITDVSLWNAASTGTFLWSATLTASVPVVNGSVLSFSSFTLGFTPIAA